MGIQVQTRRQPARANKRRAGGELSARHEAVAHREAAVLMRGQEAEAVQQDATQQPAGVYRTGDINMVMLFIFIM